MTNPKGTHGMSVSDDGNRGYFAARGPRVGAARIIDTSDETKPRVV